MMRSFLLLLPISLAAAPAMAQTTPVQVPPQVLDPAFANRLTDMMHAMSKAFLSLPVGEVAAAAEGRAPTQADRRRTVRSETGLDQRQLDQQIEGSRVAMQQGMQAMAKALPKIAEAVHSARGEVEKAMANMPSPTYPRQ